MTWLIKSKDRYFTETLYWSNDHGYVDKESATRFTDDEKHTLRLPLEGEWQEDN